MIIISGYQGVGKSTFAKETHEEKFGRKIISIDLESSNYDKTNKEWYKEYVKDILSIKDVDVIFISSHQSVRDELNKQSVRFYFVLPYVQNKHEWTEMLAKRVQSSIDNADEREKNIRALMSHILYYDAIVAELKETHKQFAKSIRPYETVEFITYPSHLKYIIYRLTDSNAGIKNQKENNMSKELEAYDTVFNHFNNCTCQEGRFLVRSALDRIYQALEQAQKQEKLLKLYKQAYDKSNAEVLKMFKYEQDEKDTLNNIIGHLDDSKTVVQIKELENERI